MREGKVIDGLIERAKRAYVDGEISESELDAYTEYILRRGECPLGLIGKGLGWNT